MLASLGHKRAIPRIRVILFHGRARHQLLLAIALAFMPMTISASAQTGFRDEIVNGPKRFVFPGSINPLPIPFFNNGHSDSNDNITVIGPDGVARNSRIYDFDDIHPLNPVFESARADENIGSRAVQVLKIIWLGDSQVVSAQIQAGYKLSQPAEALRMRDWQNSGMDGGMLKSRSAQDDAGLPFLDEVSIDEIDDSNGFGLAYGLGTLGTEQQLRVPRYSGDTHRQRHGG